MNVGTTPLYTQRLAGYVAPTGTEWKHEIKWETEVDGLYLEDGYAKVRRCENDMAAATALKSPFFSFIACYSLKEPRIRIVFFLLWSTDHLAYNLELEII